MVLAFERQERESAKAFAAFKAYLELGPERSLAAVGEKLGKSKVLMERWSRRFDWSGRVAAHGTHLAEMERKATEVVVSEKAVEWAKMHEQVRQQAWREAEDLISMAKEFKNRWRNSSRVPGFESVVRALELAFKLKQFAAGMASEIKEVNTTVTGKLDVEWEMAFKRVYQAKTGQQQAAEGAVAEVEVLADGHQVQSAECGVRNEGREGKTEDGLLTSAATGEGGAA